jgi:tripartite-type tricarboxylate transporter receptor subunit TctC
MNGRIAFLAVSLCLMALIGAPALAQQPQWPSKTVRVVLPHAPGGGTDLLARLIADRLRVAFGQPFIVENRPGAGINIGTEHVAKQPGDGYTLLVTTNTHVMNVAFYKRLPYDPIKDFLPVSLIATSPMLMAAPAGVPAKTAKEFVELAKSKPGELAYASTGQGTPQHLAGAMLESATGISMIHVPYKGGAPVVNALLGGEVAMTFGAVNALIPHVRAGKLRAFAVSDPKRSALLPEVPTVAEALSLPAYAVQLWYAVLVPAGTPRPIIDQLNTEVNKVMRDPGLQRERLSPLGLEGVGSTPEHLALVMAAEIPKYVKAARDANITPE